jgi:predicted nucleic acid-binding protein
MAANSKMLYIIDSSFILSYLLPDEDNIEVQTMFNQYKAGLVDFQSVTLLPYEIVNGIYAANLSKRITIVFSEKLINLFIKLPILLEETIYNDVLKLAQENKISVYDASYLLLSKTTNLPLLTLDKRLKKLNN